MAFESTTNISDADLENILRDEITRRQATIAVAGAPVAAQAGRTAIHSSLLGTLYDEFDEIRNNPELNDRNYDQMVRTYHQYLDQGNNPVEIFVDRPGDNSWAAGQTEGGDDVVFFDSSAPHPAVMAHELGHVQMNHSSDPLSWLQTSGVGKAAGAFAPLLGMAGGAAGYVGMPKRRLAGAALGTSLGALGGSGNFAYELGGATGRARVDLAEDVDQEDAYGALFRAGMTYGMGGPGAAVAGGITGAAAAELIRRYL